MASIAAIAVLLPSPARAYEDRAALSLEAGYAGILSDSPLPDHGFVAGFGVGFGLSDVWELRVDAAYAFHPGTLHRMRGSAEVIYVIDVLTVVPYLGLGVGALGSVSVPGGVEPTQAWADFTAHAVVGFDVLLDRDWTVGLTVRPIFLLTSLPTDPFYLTITARASYLVDL